MWFLQPLKTKEYNWNIKKLNTNSIFNLKSFVTVAILDSKSTETAFMYKVLQYELNCKFSYRLFKQEKRRLIGSFHLKQKPI